MHGWEVGARERQGREEDGMGRKWVGERSGDVEDVDELPVKLNITRHRIMEAYVSSSKVIQCYTFIKSIHIYTGQGGEKGEGLTWINSTFMLNLTSYNCSIRIFVSSDTLIHVQDKWCSRSRRAGRGEGEEGREGDVDQQDL